MFVPFYQTTRRHIHHCENLSFFSSEVCSSSVPRQTYHIAKCMLFIDTIDLTRFRPIWKRMISTGLFCENSPVFTFSAYHSLVRFKVLGTLKTWRRVVWSNFTDVSEERIASAFSVERYVHEAGSSTTLLKMETLCSSKTSMNFYQTLLRHVPEDSTLRVALSVPQDDRL
jgi:hypothetical protein